MEVEPHPTIYINNINEKIKIPVLKKQLYMLFSQYGHVSKVIAMKGLKTRGQAWVVFKETTSAISALKGKQGFVFYDKPLRLTFAKEKTESGVSKEKRAEKAVVQKSGKANKRQRDDAEEEEESGNKEARIAAPLVNNSTPNKILFAQNLPSDINEGVLQLIFQQIKGFVEVRLANPSAQTVAFIEFEDEIQSGIALRQLNGYQLNTTHNLQLTFSN